MAATKKAVNKAPITAENAMNKGDLTAIVTALLLTKGGIPTVQAQETAKYIIKMAHESA